MSDQDQDKQEDQNNDPSKPARHGGGQGYTPAPVGVKPED